MDAFEALLTEHRAAIERFVKYRIPTRADADDVLQTVYLTAFQRFEQLQKPESFKAWVLSIARNKCNDWFRERAARLELPIDTLIETALSYNRFGVSEDDAVGETLALLGDRHRQIYGDDCRKALRHSLCDGR